MPPSNVVVDGSNIATEGRTTPSLDQLDQAVRQYLEEHPGASVTVVVDASFGHRIEPSERAAFEQAVAHGELVSPPAGAIGRGDAFLLRIAERIGARVLSNDSFREFHAEHPWLFDEGRLVGGTPVPGVGWIFTPRRPVRGPLRPVVGGAGRRSSREGAGKAKSDEEDQQSESSGSSAEKAASAKRGARDGQPSSDGPKPKSGRSRGSRRGKSADGNVQAAIAEATEEALTSGEGKKQKGKPKPKSEAAPEAVNDPLPFITFASEHPVGSEVVGTVVSFTSHGAMAQVEDMLCYVPLAGLGDPPPRRARDVLRQGETRTFELVALDPSRRGAQLALPEVVAVHGEIAEGAEEAASEVRGRRKRRPASPPSAEPVSPDEAKQPSTRKPSLKAEKSKAPVKRGVRTERRVRTEQGAKATRPRGAKSAERVPDAPAKQPQDVQAQPAKQVRPPKSVAPAKKATQEKVTQEKATQEKVAQKRVAQTKRTGAQKGAPTKPALEAKAQQPAKKAQRPAGKAHDPAKKASAKAPSAKKAHAGGKVSSARKVPAAVKAAGTSKNAPRPKKTGADKVSNNKRGTREASGLKTVATRVGAKKAAKKTDKN